MSQPLTGVVPVAPTPFLDDGSLDADGTRRVIDCLLDQGVDGICILANYSEQFVLTDEERARVMRLSLEHMAGRRPVIVTISHFSTAIAVTRARAAESMGAAMVMMMPPYHGVGLVPPEEAIVEHFRAVNDAISIPIMVQDAPLSGATLSVALLTRMAMEMEHLSYFKVECPSAAEKLSELIDSAGEHVVGPFDGEEAVTLMSDLDAGATGTMTSGLQCEHIRQIVLAHREGRGAEAEAKWTECLPLINHENRQCGLRACKTVFKEGGVIASDHVRHPLRPLPELARRRLLDLARDRDLIAMRWAT